MPLSEVSTSTSGLDRARTFLPSSESPRSPILSPKEESFRPLPPLASTETPGGLCASDSSFKHAAISQWDVSGANQTRTEVDSSDELPMVRPALGVHVGNDGVSSSHLREDDMEEEGEELMGEYSESEASECEGTPSARDGSHDMWHQTRFMDAGQMPVHAALSCDGELHVIGSYNDPQGLDNAPLERSYSLQVPPLSQRDGLRHGDRKSRSDTEREERAAVMNGVERASTMQSTTSRFGRARGVVHDRAQCSADARGVCPLCIVPSSAATLDAREDWREEEREAEECVMEVRAPLPAEDDGDLGDLDETEIWGLRDPMGSLGENRNRIGSGFLEVIVGAGAGYEAGDEGDGDECADEEDLVNLDVRDEEGISNPLPESATGLPLSAQGFF